MLLELLSHFDEPSQFVHLFRRFSPLFADIHRSAVVIHKFMAEPSALENIHWFVA